MRIAPLLLSMLLGASLLATKEQTSDVSRASRVDPYFVAFVDSAFHYYKDSIEHRTPISGFEVARCTNGHPSLYELGDAVSIAALKNCEIDELAKPENASIYLTLVKIAFSDQNKVLEKSDREPRITTLVLDYLEKKETEPILE
jgi:hypothetical protein